MKIYIWQRMVTPHMSGLAEALVRAGVTVTYVAEEMVSEDRAQQGWEAPALAGVALCFMPTAEAVQQIVQVAPEDAIHLCQGIRGNGRVRLAQRLIAARGLPHWVVMETVDDAGWRGVLKRLEYRRLLWRWQNSLQGVLAIGYRMPGWVVRRGVPGDKVFPFAYFLPRPSGYASSNAESQGSRFRFLFVGNLVERKRVGFLIQALSRLPAKAFELAVVGDGPLSASLRALAESLLPGQVNWLGRLPMATVPAVMAQADCLVLPSRHDGWGAVVSEALMAGTPALCSDRCGAAGVVRASGQGGVFRSGDGEDLTAHLWRLVAQGPLPATERIALAAWAHCLSEDAGAQYLLRILDYQAGNGCRPAPPWEAASWR